MNIHHHPDDASLMAYAAGTLNEGFSLLLAAHIELCPRCQTRVIEAETLGGTMLFDLQPEEQPTGGIEDVWLRIENNTNHEQETTYHPLPENKSQAEFPMILSPYIEGRLEDISWRSLVPGIRQHVLKDVDSDNGSVRLLSIAPGVTIPHHTHKGGELTLILRGSYIDEIGRFSRGDIADLDTSNHHQPVADTGEDCICLIATDERLRFSGVFSRMLQPLIGI
jgi:putative transcriptional regulator